MGIPYSREINAAFEQVTPLVAAGFKVLTTMKNISVLLAAIQILTVVCLMAILSVLVALVYCVNPDLESEREQFVTPVFRKLAHLTFVGVLESAAVIMVGFIGFVVVGFFLVASKRPNHLEGAGNRDADAALDGMKEEEEKQKEKENKGKSGKEKADEGAEEGKK